MLMFACRELRGGDLTLSASIHTADAVPQAIYGRVKCWNAENYVKEFSAGLRTGVWY
jgi:hypothetical protein